MSEKKKISYKIYDKVSIQVEIIPAGVKLKLSANINNRGHSESTAAYTLHPFVTLQVVLKWKEIESSERLVDE